MTHRGTGLRAPVWILGSVAVLGLCGAGAREPANFVRNGSFESFAQGKAPGWRLNGIATLSSTAGLWC
jgi:hypothetical protein